MNARFILYIIACEPAVITLATWMRLYWAPPNQRHALALLALGFASANAALACGTFLYYEFRPSPHFLPPWQDPKVLDLGLLLFFLTPIAMILGGVAGAHGAPKWLVAVIAIASLPLFVVGITACIIMAGTV